ncbi:MAG: hypothetical protein ABW199_11205, partial [Caulobacterales bacterium]
GALLVLAGMNRDLLERILGSKELVMAALAFAAAGLYFPLLFVLRAVTLGEVKAAFRRDPGPRGGGGGLPAGFDA